MQFGPRVHLALLGLRCSGKSSVGRELARLLDRELVDLDERIVRLFGAEDTSPARTAGLILEERGESRFRDLEETALVETLLAPRPLVIATGGGVVERPANRRRLAGACVCVWLRAPLPELARRMRSDPTPRPSLTGADPADELEALARRRDPWYAATADLAYDCGRRGPEEIARAIAGALDPARFRSQG